MDSAILQDYTNDDWPTMPDGTDFDGTQLLTWANGDQSPFKKDWDVNLLFREVEQSLDTAILDVVLVSRGSNNYGFHFKLSNRPDIIARVARGDVNMPGFDGFSPLQQASEVRFEAAAYKLLLSEPGVGAARLLYHRAPVQYSGTRLNRPIDIGGRRMFFFEKTEGRSTVWETLDSDGKVFLLSQAACMRASLFRVNPPTEFMEAWFLDRLFEHKPDRLPVPVTPTRNFCLAVLTSKINATIRNIGDMIGWPSDEATVGPVAYKAKGSLLQLIPHILPPDTSPPSLYRLVLEHGDWGIHNMTITDESKSRPTITSVYDWETGCIWPAIFSDPLMAIYCDLTTDEYANPAIARVNDDKGPEIRAQYMEWSRHYFSVLFEAAPQYKEVIKAGKDVRHLWYALRDWRGDDAEDFFGGLGAWAETRLKELGVGYEA